MIYATTTARLFTSITNNNVQLTKKYFIQRGYLTSTKFDLTDPAKLMSYNQNKSNGNDKASLPSSSGSNSTSTPHTSGMISSMTANITQSALPSSSSTTIPQMSHFSSTPTSMEPIKKWNPQLTKIVATIGPTSEQLPVLQDIVGSGMRIMRLNFSHATVEEVELRVKNLRLCKGRHAAINANGIHKNVRGILLDTRGPEIRMGKLRNDTTGHHTIQLQAGDTVTLHTSPDWADQGSIETDLYIDYAKLHKCLKPGNKVLLDDGTVTLSVQSVEDMKEFHGTVTCTVDNSGELRSRAGVNIPGVETDMPAMSTKDKIDIKYGLTKDVDYVAASFIQNAQGVRDIRRYMRECAEEIGLDPTYPLPLIISKIESVAALQNFDEILLESDGIMVARGDLGVEIPIQQVTNAQKEMVAACNAVGKPVIVATQMLESMAKNPRPTRAEVADVTNAVYDGADAVMLSGETAKGKYPVETVRMMNEIILTAENFASSRPDLIRPSYGGTIFANNDKLTDHDGMEISIAKAAVAAAMKRKAVAIIVLHDTGSNLPRLVSAFRPNVPIVVFTPSCKTARQLIIYRGVHPVGGMLDGLSPPKRAAAAIKYAKSLGYVESGDSIVVVGMEADADIADCASMKVSTVP